MSSQEAATDASKRLKKKHVSKNRGTVVIKQIVSDRGLEAGMNMNSIKQSLYWMFIIIPHSEKEKVNYSLLICDFTQVNTSVERE